jgi:hypothetical protein
MIQYYKNIETNKAENISKAAFRAQQIYLILIGLAANRQTITYGGLVEKWDMKKPPLIP